MELEDYTVLNAIVYNPETDHQRKTHEFVNCLFQTKHVKVYGSQKLGTLRSMGLNTWKNP